MVIRGLLFPPKINSTGKQHVCQEGLENFYWPDEGGPVKGSRELATPSIVPKFKTPRRRPLRVNGFVLEMPIPGWREVVLKGDQRRVHYLRCPGEASATRLQDKSKAPAYDCRSCHFRSCHYMTHLLVSLPSHSDPPEWRRPAGQGTGVSDFKSPKSTRQLNGRRMKEALVRL